MRRRADWPARLDRLLAERADMPFVWGQSDCVQLAKAGLEAVSAANWSAVEWPVYGSAHSAWKSLRALGYDDLPALATALLGPALPGPYARRGDLVAIACPHWGGALGLCTGREVVLPALYGLAHRPLEQTFCCWRI